MFLREYYKQLYTNEFDNLDEITKYPEVGEYLTIIIVALFLKEGYQMGWLHTAPQGAERRAIYVQRGAKETGE